jgi:hypothetical protein
MVSVRLAPEEQEVLRAEANEKGESLSQYIRDVLLQRTGSAQAAVDVRLYPASTTSVTGGLAIEAQDGHLVPKTTQPYVVPVVPA